MNTSVKVSVADRTERSYKRTTSGGVKDPADPEHYPALGSTAANAAPNNIAARHLSRLPSSFKESLNSNKLPMVVRTEDDSIDAANSSKLDGVDKGSQVQPLESPSRSPKISAQRPSPASTPQAEDDAAVNQVSPFIRPGDLIGCCVVCYNITFSCKTVIRRSVKAVPTCLLVDVLLVLSC